MQLLLAHLNHFTPAQRLAAPLVGQVCEIGRDLGLMPGPEWPDEYVSRCHVRVWQEEERWCIGRVAAEGGKEKARLSW